MAAHSDGPSPARHLVHDGKDMVIMLGVTLFAVAGVGTWLWGEAAGLLARGGFPRVAMTQSITIALHLPGHLGDPRGAWPLAAASSLPGAPVFYLAGVLLLVLGAAGKSAQYTAKLPIKNPQLWDLDHPNLYHVVSTVRVGQKVLDDHA